MEIESCSFDKLYVEVLLSRFEAIADNRRHNNVYAQSEALKSGFALYSLKSSSLFAFRQYTKAETHNLRSIYKVKSIPWDNGLRKILDQVDSQELRKGFQDFSKDFEKTQNKG